MSVALDDQDTIHKAVERCDLEAVRRFLEVEGVAVDCRDEMGNSPLLYAVLLYSQRKVVPERCTQLIPLISYLVSKNADVNEAMNTVRGRYSPLSIASNFNKFDLVAQTWSVSLDHCRSTMTEIDFDKFLLQEVDNNGRIALHYYNLSSRILQLLVEQPRNKDNQLLPACHAQLVRKDKRGFTPRQEHSTDFQCVRYLDTFESLVLSVPVSDCTSSVSAKRQKLNDYIAVKLNPALNDFQRSVAEEALDLIMETTESPDAIAHAILGYISPLDVMKRSTTETNQ